MKKMIPFGPASATTIDDLTIETDEDSLVISGSIEFERDKDGLNRLERLQSIVQDAIAALKAEDLPEKAEGPLPDGPNIPNPFA